MKLKNNPTNRGDTSLLDLFAIIAAVAIVGTVGYAYLRPAQRRSKAINCVNHLKQVGLSFRMWSQDNGDKYPAQVSTNLGGAKEFVAAGGTFRQFQVMSNELSTPRVILCPTDSARSWATNFETLTEVNVSYFVVPEDDESLPEMWLSGDRNLAISSQALRPGLFWLPTNRTVGWAATIHTNRGNICLTDGSVQQYSNAKLQQSATNALRAFLEQNTNAASFRLLIP